MARLAPAGKAQQTAVIAKQRSKAQNSNGVARHSGVERHSTAAKRRGTSQQQPSGKARHSTVEHIKVVRHSRIQQAAAVKRGTTAAERNGEAWPALQSDQAKPEINNQPPSESDQATI